jgi:IS30 family transposase
MARALGRSLSTRSRECRRGEPRLDYDAVEGGAWARSHRRHGSRKLTAGSPLAELVEQKIILHAWSPEQIAGRLRTEHPEDPDQRVSHETIYQYIYAHPTGNSRSCWLGPCARATRNAAEARIAGAAFETCALSVNGQRKRSRGGIPGHWGRRPH